MNEEIVQCRYTGKMIPISQAVISPALIPGVKSTLYHENSPEGWQHHKENVAAYEISEANCNTCKYLKRIKHEKDSSGFLYGICEKKSQLLSEYTFHKRDKDGIMTFHPHDPMGMDCYESRR